ncbi:hypothetical protein FNV58_01080 (plasmid) [Streptomyces sp. RLB1-9]|uniref:hypothetical protein n=1 Tax=Streptomyces sp. RLB1-9 TaxID=2594454 RepID=UPI0011629A0E|nr:hypothetical protein [Streptomyces sp. RLB1-9]QDN94954.1 hypothetical protein FNV58_01080 [Streptomyces sp. RLB1-9]
MATRPPTDAARQRAAEHLALQAADALTAAGHPRADATATGWATHPIPGEVHVSQRGGTIWSKNEAAEAYAATLQAAGFTATIPTPGTVLIPAHH